MKPLRSFLRHEVRRAARHVLTGRLIDKTRPERGRFLRHQVDRIVAQVWQHMEEVLPEAELERIPTLGNRQNVFLSALTVAAYHALLDFGIPKDYAIELFADLGWKLYSKPVPFLGWVARLASRDPQKQLNLILRMLMVYPFSTPGPPGYECHSWAESGRFCTDWTYCPPYAFVRKYVAKHGDRGEVEAFRRSWCDYDWAITYAMLNGGAGERGHYEREHTLSDGDAVCDMRWYASPTPHTKASELALTRKGSSCVEPSVGVFP